MTLHAHHIESNPNKGKFKLIFFFFAFLQKVGSYLETDTSSLWAFFESVDLRMISDGTVYENTDLGIGITTERCLDSTL